MRKSQIVTIVVLVLCVFGLAVLLCRPDNLPSKALKQEKKTQEEGLSQTSVKSEIERTPEEIVRDQGQVMVTFPRITAVSDFNQFKKLHPTLRAIGNPTYVPGTAGISEWEVLVIFDHDPVYR
jgi:hypothetical protein